MKYFTSDLHFHHPFVAALRGYTYHEYAHMNAEELRIAAKYGNITLADMVDWRAHDKQIIDNINTTVGETDELYILGDLSTGGVASMSDALGMIDQLNVPRDNRHLILGNHDMPLVQRMGEQLLHRFASVGMNGATVIDDRNILLSHFQYRHHFGETPERLSTNACAPEYARYALVDDNHSLLLHGHTHSTAAFEFPNSVREFNIGVDAWHMKPVSEETIRDTWQNALANHEDYMRLIADLKHIREQKGLSVEDQAERMGVTASEVEAIEHGELPATSWQWATCVDARITSSVEPAENQPDGKHATNKKEQQ